MFKPKYKILMDTIGFSKVINIFLLTHDHGKIERGTIRLCKKIDVCTLACLVIGWPLTQDSLTWSGEGFLSGRESHDGSITSGRVCSARLSECAGGSARIK